jgi:prepilin-type N-terminal cleavage/methylation domain-containing protein
MVTNKLQRGDTLVEVLMAIVVLSMVIVGAITLMARGLSAVQVAVEHTQVRLGMAGQTELLHYLRDAYLTDPLGPAGQVWSGLFAGSPRYADTTPSAYNDDCTVTNSKVGFYLQQSGNTVTAQTFDPNNLPTTVASPGQGLWIEATRSAAGISPAYVDFQLHACWPTLGIGSATQQTVTVERLYDPAN